jgi:hypothetical protein
LSTAGRPNGSLKNSVIDLKEEYNAQVRGMIINNEKKTIRMIPIVENTGYFLKLRVFEVLAIFFKAFLSNC